MVLLVAATVAVPVVVYLYEVESWRQYFASIGVILILLFYVLLSSERLFCCYVLVIFFMVWAVVSIIVHWSSNGLYPAVLVVTLAATYILIVRIGKEKPF